MSFCHVYYIGAGNIFASPEVIQLAGSSYPFGISVLPESGTRASLRRNERR